MLFWLEIIGKYGFYILGGFISELDLTKILFQKTYCISFYLILLSFFETRGKEKLSKQFCMTFFTRLHDYMQWNLLQRIDAFRLFLKPLISVLPISVLLRHFCRYILHSIRLLKKTVNRKRIQFYKVWILFIYFFFLSFLSIYFCIILP